MFILRSSLFAAAVALTAGARSIDHPRDVSPQAAVKCPAGFKNTVFNIDALHHPGNISHTWADLASHGVSQFIAFNIYPMWNSSNYNHTENSKPSPKTPTVDAHQVHMVRDLSLIDDAIALITNPKTAPKYLELLNEPDLNKIDPTKAANKLERLFNVKREGKTKTIFIGSPLANSRLSWSKDFYKACNNCSHLIELQGVHSYHIKSEGVLADVAFVRKQFPGKDIWLTETSPATLKNPCDLNDSQMIAWMKTAIPALAKTGYVKKVFWNRGTFGVRSNSPNNCDTSLVDDHGNPRQLLREYQKLC